MKSTELCFGRSLWACSDRSIFRNLQNQFLEGWLLRTSILSLSLFDEAQRQHSSVFPAQQWPGLNTKELWITHSFCLCVFFDDTWLGLSSPRGKRKLQHKKSPQPGAYTHLPDSSSQTARVSQPQLWWASMTGLTHSENQILFSFLKIQDLPLLCLS